MVILLIAILPTISLAQADQWKNFYTVCWVDNPSNNIKYAKQMGYDYIGINDLIYVATLNAIPNRADLKFYFVNPQWAKEYLYQGYSPIIPLARSYTQTEQDFFEQYMAWKSPDPFPNNLATGWFDAAANRPYSMLDFQQQAVIDYAVTKTIERAYAFENLHS